jgi:hypothetical protein
LNAGAVVSTTVTLKDFVIELFDLSFAVQFTFVVPTENVLPEFGEQLTLGDGSAMSLAEAEKETAAPDGPVASTV